MAEAGKATALQDVLVVELGSRCGVSAAASLLAQLGAEVIFVEPFPGSGAADTSSSKMRYRSQFAAGKRSLIYDRRRDAALLEGLLRRASVVITSSDVDGKIAPDWATRQTVLCDVTAYGRDGEGAGSADTEWQIQAVSGIIETTGLSGGKPLALPFPAIELMTGVYAAGAILAALRVNEATGQGQFIDMALYDCAFAAMATFLPRLLAGETAPIRRMGNRHPMIAPWNVYRADDGWVLICVGNDAQWRRFCEAIDRPQLVGDTRFVKTADRVAHSDDVDAAVQDWVGGHCVERVIATLIEIEIACGPVSAIDGYPREANLTYRDMIRKVADGVNGHSIALPGSPLRMSETPGRPPTDVPMADSGRERCRELAASDVPASARHEPIRLPLAGIRIVEVGHYTTVPLSTRMLASMGADVIKIEPPEGEATREWPPAQDGQGYFFTLMNSDKRSVVLDIRNDGDAEKLRQLLETADVLIENLKPGAMARRGFSQSALAEINPRLISCSVSGFGVFSLYSGRPAYDTVIQAMSGVMTTIRDGDVPVKTGISSADLLGAEFAIVAVLAALAHRDRSGEGQTIDLSMQDIAAWMTQTLWTDPTLGRDRVRVVSCRDGYLLVEAVGESGVAELARLGETSALPWQALSGNLHSTGLRAAPILTVQEMLAAPRTTSRRLWFEAPGADGKIWPLLASPMRLTATPPQVRKPMPHLGSDNAAVLGTAVAIEEAS